MQVVISKVGATNFEGQPSAAYKQVVILQAVPLQVVISQVQL